MFGAIIKGRVEVHGLATAVSLWVTPMPGCRQLVEAVLAIGLGLACWTGSQILLPAFGSSPLRAPARDLVAEMGSALRSWLFGRLVGMAFIGVSTGIGPWIPGAPQTLALGLLAALLAVPAVLASMPQGPITTWPPLDRAADGPAPAGGHHEPPRLGIESCGGSYWITRPPSSS